MYIYAVKETGIKVIPYNNEDKYCSNELCGNAFS